MNKQITISWIEEEFVFFFFQEEWWNCAIINWWISDIQFRDQPLNFELNYSRECERKIAHQIKNDLSKWKMCSHTNLNILKKRVFFCAECYDFSYRTQTVYWYNLVSSWAFYTPNPSNHFQFFSSAIPICVHRWTRTLVSNIHT